MRLIDADKLTPENTHIIERIETVDGYKIKTYEIICDAPTVEPCEDCVSRTYIESIVEELENICMNGDEHILSLLSDIKNAPPVTPTIPEVENDYNIGYNCGYADAISDMAESEG